MSEAIFILIAFGLWFIIGAFTGFLIGKCEFKPILKIEWKDEKLYLLIQNENNSRHWIDAGYKKQFLKND